MKIVVRMTAKQEAKALPILLRHTCGMVLQDRTYILSAEAVQKLRDAKIKFTEIGRDGTAPSISGESGEKRV